MGHFPLVNAKILLDEFDLSGDMNSITIERSQAALPDDTFGSSKSLLARIPGLNDGVIGMAGLVELTDNGQDEILSGNMSLSNIPLLVALQNPAFSSRCKFGVIQQGQYQSGGNVGGRAEWSADGRISNHALVDGLIGFFGNEVSVSGVNSGPQQLGALSATQKIYWAVHVTEFTGSGDLTFELRSDDSDAFSSPTTRQSTATETGRFSFFGSVSGPITDDWWAIRAVFTNTSFRAYSAIGIL